MNLTMTRVRPNPIVVQRQNDLYDLWDNLVAEHSDEPDYDPDDDPEFVTQARQIMGLPPFGESITKAAKDVQAAGLAVRAKDTGRVLMLQRALPDKDDDDPDPNAGLFEFPGGHLDDDESSEEAARREWAEETGCKVPKGKITGEWTSADGVYRGYVLTIKHEDDVPHLGDRDKAENPDDPDGDRVETIIWLDPAHLPDNPMLRPELADSLTDVLPLLPPGKLRLNKCLTCGCDTPNTDHGDRRNITLDELKAAADAAGITVEEAAANIREALNKAAAHGHHVPGTPYEYRHGWERVEPDVSPAGEHVARHAARTTGSVKTKKKAGDLLEEADAHQDESGELPPDLRESIGEVFEGVHAGFTVKLKQVQMTGYGRMVSVDLSITDSDGHNAGRAVRVIGRDSRGNLFVEHELLKIGRGHRGQGFAQSFNREMEDWYRDSGVQRIELNADIDVGGYAWSRQGYTWRDGEVPKDVRNRLVKAMASDVAFDHSPDGYHVKENFDDVGNPVYEAYGPGGEFISTHEYYDDADDAIAQHVLDHHPLPDTPEIRAAKHVLARINAGEPVTPFEISEIGRPVNAGRDDMWIGKSALLGSNWDGVKWL